MVDSSKVTIQPFDPDDVEADGAVEDDAAHLYAKEKNTSDSDKKLNDKKQETSGAGAVAGTVVPPEFSKRDKIRQS